MYITKMKTLAVVFANPSTVYSNRSSKEYVDNEEEHLICRLCKSLTVYGNRSSKEYVANE